MERLVKADGAKMESEKSDRTRHEKSEEGRRTKMNTWSEDSYPRKENERRGIKVNPNLKYGIILINLSISIK